MGENKRVEILNCSLTAIDNTVLTKACERQFAKMDVGIINLGWLDSKDREFAVSMIIRSGLTKIIIMNAHPVDSDDEQEINRLTSLIRKNRKDIFLASIRMIPAENMPSMYVKGLHICKTTSSNLVMATYAGMNMIVAPEETQYDVHPNMMVTLNGLLDMIWHRSHLTFTQSTVGPGNPIAWDSILVPEVLRNVVDYCIEQHAYKPFNGVTAGHFAVKLDDNTFLSSIRKTNFNRLREVGLVKVVTDGPDTVIAFGAKPSVGGQSQRIVFKDHPEYDCVLHFHCPLREGSEVPVVSQRQIQCGSHECGRNTSQGFKQFGNLKAVYLDNHGPNIIFNKSVDPQEVIDFINNNFDLSQKTGGFVSTTEI